MNKYILIMVENNISRFINKCKNYDMELHELTYIDKNKIIVKINKSDYKLIKRYNYYSEIEIYNKLGMDKIKENIFKERYFILLFIILLIGMFLISNIIVKVNVIHSNKSIREFVTNELVSYGIKKYGLKKDFNELNKIKDKILEKNKDKLEWISITNIGMTMVVRIEERIIDEIKKQDEYCNVISTKDAIITNIYGTNGEILINTNDIVKPNDILISGSINLNEENKGFTCARGKVLGKVWYNTNITVKRDYQKKEYTGKSRFNFTIKNKILRNNKYNNFDKKYIIKFSFFTLYKENEYKLINYKYNALESEKKALEEVEKNFQKKLGSSGKIISNKILSKSLNENNINLTLFVVTEENISKQIKNDIPKIEKEEDIN